jgi:uncharacterized protein YbcI
MAPLPQGGELNAALARAVVGEWRDQLGRGPTKAQAFYRGKVVVVILSDCMTTLEQNLAAGGQTKALRMLHGGLERAMRKSLVGTVEELTGRKVDAFMSAHSVEPDVVAELFVLDEPVGAARPGWH